MSSDKRTDAHSGTFGRIRHKETRTFRVLQQLLDLQVAARTTVQAEMLRMACLAANVPQRKVTAHRVMSLPLSLPTLTYISVLVPYGRA